MPRIARDSLLTLEAYARERTDFRARVLAHKKPRSVHLGEHLVVLFEDAGIQDELDTYNPLVPDGNNWKATMQVEYEDVEERKRALGRLKGIEDRVWVKVEGQPRVYAIADEDLERESDEKTSSVHFLRFELTPSMISALKAGGGLAIGVDHPQYSAALDPVPDATRNALL